MAPCLLASLAGACSGNRPPDIAPLGPLEVVVGNTLTAPLAAEDPDGDRVRFEVQGAPQGAEVREGDPWVFVYSPIATDAAPGGRRYDLEVIATDGRGGRTTIPASLTVNPEGSLPTFEGAVAWTLDLSKADHVAVPIRVRDDDTAEVRLTLERPLEGAVFETWDGHRASLYFKPTAAQVASDTLWTFTVGAEDGIHRKVLQEFAILRVNADLFGGCRGTPPLAAHEPPPESVGPGVLPLVVTASDDDSRVASVECRWTATGDEADADRNVVHLEPSDDGTFRGAIPDLSAAAGAGLLVRYACTATDDDDPHSAACDHVRRLPKSGDFSVSIRAGGTTPCLRDGTGADAGGAPLPWGRTADLRLCDGQASRFTVERLPGEPFVATARAQSGGPAPRLEILDPTGAVSARGDGVVRSLPDVAGTWSVAVAPPGSAPVTYTLEAAPMDSWCEPDSPGVESAGTAPDLAPGVTIGTLCPGEVGWRALHLRAGDVAHLTLTFDAGLADLDLALLPARDAPPVRLSEGTGATERVTLRAEAPIDLLVRIASTDLRGTDWRLEARFDAGACVEDLLAPNDTPGNAPSLPEGTWDNLHLCPGTADHVRLGLNGGEALHAEVVSTPGAVPPPLAILAADGEMLVGGEADGNRVTARLAIPDPGDYLLRVGPAPSGVASYSLAFTASDPDGPCRPDRLEPNDDLADPPTLPDGFTTRLLLCAGDTDAFAFSLAPWQTLSVIVVAGSASPHAVLKTLDGAVRAEGIATDYGEELVSVARDQSTVVLILTAPEPGWYDVAIGRE